MANMCWFNMCVKGTNENIIKFIMALQQQSNYYMGRGAYCNSINISPIDENNDVAYISGECKWSVLSALIDNAISMRTNTNMWSFGDVDTSKIKFITLVEASKKWKLDVEIFSEECGMCFQEHYIICKGEVKTDDCVDYCDEISLEDYQNKKEAEEDLDREISNSDWENGFIPSTGGFGDWEFTI